MGHVSVLGNNREEVIAKIEQVKSAVQVIAE